MWTYEVLPLSIDILNYLVPMWQVAQTSSIILLFAFVVKLVFNIIPIYHRKISLYTPCTWQVILIIVVDFVDHLHIGSCIELPHLLPNIYFDSHCLPCLLCGSFVVLLILFSVVNNIWIVMTPFVCILYSNANLKIMHESWGSFPLLFTTLSYQLIIDILTIGIVSLSYVFMEDKTFLLMLCAIM